MVKKDFKIIINHMQGCAPRTKLKRKETYKTFFSNGILRKMKCVAAKHNGAQIMQSRNHFATGYKASGLNKSVTGMMIIGWNM